MVNFSSEYFSTEITVRYLFYLRKIHKYRISYQKCYFHSPGISSIIVISFPPSLRMKISGFPGGAVVENLPANAGDTGSSPGLGRSHMPRSN